MSYPSNGIGCSSCAPQTATPNHMNLPTGSNQVFGCAPISGTVLRDFVRPEWSIGLRKSPLIAVLMAVPETAMNEDNLAPRGEDNVRFSRQILPVEGIAVSGPVQSRPEQHLRCRILRAHRRHEGTSLLRAEIVDHNLCESSLYSSFSRTWGELTGQCRFNTPHLADHYPLPVHNSHRQSLKHNPPVSTTSHRSLIPNL